MAKTKSKKQYATYAAENRVLKNKIKKLERHCKAYPEDELGKKHLARIKKDGYTGRSKPNVPGSNSTTPKVKFMGAIQFPPTPGEQLSKLLGIPLIKPQKKFKPTVKHKPKRK